MLTNKRRRKPANPKVNAPQYKPDDGPLSAKQQSAVRRMQKPGRIRVKQALF